MMYLSDPLYKTKNTKSKFESNVKGGKVLRRIYPHNIKYLPLEGRILKKLWGMYIVELDLEWVQHKNDAYARLVGML